MTSNDHKRSIESKQGIISESIKPKAVSNVKLLEKYDAARELKVQFVTKPS